jgi:predicted flap endonuclease-1-like 5' DNA nuclease
LTEIKSERASILAEVNSAKAELSAAAENQKRTLRELTAERDRVVLSLRRETPVTAVTGAQERFTKVLAERGVTNLARLSKMTDPQLKAAATAAGLHLNTAKRFRREAGARLEAPIQ